MDIKIGADPELFLKRGDVYHSAFGLIPGTKKQPHPVEKGAVQVDGMALEFNIDPSSDEETFNMNINTVLAKLREMVPPEFEFDFKASVNFPEDHMHTQPLEALELGCEPDFNAWTESLNPEPRAPETLRAAGGHVHVGWTEDRDIEDPAHLSSCFRLAKQLDYMLGIPSVLLDTDTQRRSLYGKAGAFRPKPYGMEYRTLSNFWVTSEELRRWVFRQANSALTILVKDRMDLGARFGTLAQDVIDDNRPRIAELFIADNPQLFRGLPSS